MLRKTLLTAMALSGAAVFAPGLNAAQFLVVTRSSAWKVEAADLVSVNGKDKLRSSAVAAARPAIWDAKSVGRLPNVPLQSLALIRRAPDGTVWGRIGASPEWTLLLPDASQIKAPGSAAALWQNSTLTVTSDRKEKSGLTVRTGDLYAIVPGMDVAASAGHMATDLEMHKAPGVDSAAAFRQMVELVPSIVQAYPTGAGMEQIRQRVRGAMVSRLEKWSAGDAAITELEETLLLAKSSAAAFPEDAAQKKLRTDAQSAKYWLDRRIAILRALDVGRQSDPFLVAYREFEPYDRSFSDLALVRRKHLEASALAHVDDAKRLRTEGDYVGAIRHLRVAQLRKPDLAEATRLLEQVRLEVARLSSQQFAEARRGIDSRSAIQVQVQRRMSLAEQYINDSKPVDAERTLADAESIDKDEPRIKLLQANLAVLRGDLGLALALLDLYAGMAITPQAFAEGEKLRASVHYKIENERIQKRAELKGLLANQRFGTALQSAADSLKVDNEEPSFLYQAGVNACLLRHCAEGAPLLRRFLELTDSTTGSREQRIAAVRLLQRSAQPAKAVAGGKSTQVSWFSGDPLEPGAFYDPISLAFQPKVARIGASDHLSVSYEWKGNLLQSVHTKYEDKKTAGNVARLALGIGMAAGAGAGSVKWKTADRETTDFYFNYYDDVPQIFNVNRDKQVVKSRTISIMIPGIGGFGAIGALAGLGGLGSLGSLGSLGGLGGMRGMGGMQGLSGLGSWGGLIATASSLKRPGGLAGLTGMSGIGFGSSAGFAPRSYSIHGDPQGGAASGYLTLWNNPRLDTELAFAATGKRVAVGFSGNHFFHPFGWDGLHLFEFDYDTEGRVQHAWELDQPNPPRLDFTWDGKRLMSVVARDPSPAANAIYSRTLSYSENRLTGEVILANGKTSHIRYKYDKQGRLLEAECTDDASLDGRSRKVEFLVDTADKGKS